MIYNLSASFAPGPAIQQTETNSKREPDDSEDDAYTFRSSLSKCKSPLVTFLGLTDDAKFCLVLVLAFLQADHFGMVWRKEGSNPVSGLGIDIVVYSWSSGSYSSAVVGFRHSDSCRYRGIAWADLRVRWILRSVSIDRLRRCERRQIVRKANAMSCENTYDLLTLWPGHRLAGTRMILSGKESSVLVYVESRLRLTMMMGVWECRENFGSRES